MNVEWLLYNNSQTLFRASKKIHPVLLKRLFSSQDKMDSSRPRRYFLNPWLSGCRESGDLSQELCAAKTSELIKIVTSKQPPSPQDGDGGLYVGVGGIGYMLYHVSQSVSFSSEKSLLLQKGLEYIKAAIHFSNQSVPVRQAEECAFLLGPAGIYAVAASLHHAAGTTLLLLTQQFIC